LSKPASATPGSRALALHRLMIATFRLNGALLELGDAMTRDVELTGSRWQVLATLMARPLTVPQIARRLGVQRQSVQQIVEVLLRHQFVQLADNPDHARSRLVALTEQGARAARRMRARELEWTERCAAGLSDVELEAATHTLQQLTAQVEPLAAGTTPPRRAAQAAGEE
jgi:DNA-binding MarR family transcriptional regulator